MKVTLKQSSGLGRYGAEVDLEDNLAKTLIATGKAVGGKTAPPPPPAPKTQEA